MRSWLEKVSFFFNGVFLPLSTNGYKEDIKGVDAAGCHGDWGIHLSYIPCHAGTGAQDRTISGWYCGYVAADAYFCYAVSYLLHH